jgi:hypothetical protein
MKKATKMTNSIVSMRVRESIEDNLTDLTFVAIDDEKNSLRLTINNLTWEISISKVWMVISASGKKSDSVTHVIGTVGQKEESTDAKIVIDCGMNPPLMAICLPTAERSFHMHRFEISHDLQEKVISMLSTMTYIEPVQETERCVA